MDRMVVPALVEATTAQTLVATLSRPDGAVGATLMDQGFVTALIEAETMGRLRPGPLPDRSPTRIDALIAGPFLDRGLVLFDEVASSLSIAETTTGFRFGDVISQPGMLALLLEDQPYRTMRLGFDFCDGTRQGSVLLAMPFDPPAKAASDDKDGFSRDLQEMVMTAPAQVQAVLTRLSLPLDEVTAWEPGDLVPMSRDVLDGVTLEDIDGTPVGRGRLGQSNGCRAVRLRMPD